MKKFKIIVDSSCTIPIDVANKLDIKKFSYEVIGQNGEIVKDNFTRELIEETLSKINEKYFFKSSMYSPILVEEMINEELKEYNQVFYITSSIQFTGQYENTKYVQEKNPNRVFIINSNSTCSVIEEIAYKIIEHFQKNETIDQEKINEIVNYVNKHSCTLFIPKNLIGLMHSGRIPSSLIKLLKLAKVTPIIKTEEKNKPCKLMKNNDKQLLKMLDTFNEIFVEKIKDNLVNKIYIFETILNNEKINEIVETIHNYFKIAKEKIHIRMTPLPIAVHTLKESFGITFHMLCEKKS